MNTSPEYRGSGLSFVEIVEILWRARLVIVAATVGMGIVAFGLSFAMTPEYVATATLRIRSQNSSSGSLASLAGQFGGLASLAGVSLHGGNDESAVALATLKSREIIDQFVQKNDLLPILFSGRWNKKKQDWVVWFKGQIPNVQDAYKLFTHKILNVENNRSTGIIKVSVEWKNPTQACEWLREIVEDANTKLRQRAIKRSQADIAYLLSQAQHVTIVPVRTALYDLAAVEYKKLMIAQNREDSDFEVIDPAQVPLRPTTPRPLMLTAIGVLLGAVTGVLYALLRATFVARKVFAARSVDSISGP